MSRVLGAASEATDATIRDYDREVDRVAKGDDCPPRLKLVKVYVAPKRSSRLVTSWPGATVTKAWCGEVPEEDMPFMPDGTPVEIVLNPLGVPPG